MHDEGGAQLMRLLNRLRLILRRDIIIDGGNSYFPDTIRRVTEAEHKGLLYVGAWIFWW